MKIVVTGGLGFIGRHLSSRLLADGHDVLLIDSLSPQIHGELPVVEAPQGAVVVRMDICDMADRYQLIEGSDVIFHLAAETGTAQSMYQVSRYSDVNCGGTAALLEAVAKCARRPKKIILASSRSVYGEGAYTLSSNPGITLAVTSRSREALEKRCWEPVDEFGRNLTAIPTPEKFPFSPGSIYAATKAAQELFLTSSCVALGVHSTIFRFQNVYGEGQSLLNPYTGIISIFFNRARQGLSIPVYEDGCESRDFVNVKDVVAGLVTSLQVNLPNGIAMNLGSGNQTTVYDLAVKLLKVSGYKVPIEVTGQYRLGDIRHCFADLTQVRQHLGFSPKVSLEDGLNDFCAWAKTQPVHVDLSVKAESELKQRGLTN